MRTTQLQINNLNELEATAQKLLELCINHKNFAFYGKVGAGKTTLIKAICGVLDCEDNIASPTFALVNEYKREGQHTIGTVYHMDLYRLEAPEEAMDIGLDDYLYDETAFCFIEWPEIIEPWLPEGTVKVSINVNENNTRTLIINN